MSDTMIPGSPDSGSSRRPSDTTGLTHAPSRETGEALLAMAHRQLAGLAVSSRYLPVFNGIRNCDLGLRSEILGLSGQKTPAVLPAGAVSGAGDALILEDSYYIFYAVLGLGRASASRTSGTSALACGEPFSCFLIGPYTNGRITRQTILNVCGKYRLSADRCRQVEDYYSRLPVLTETGYLQSLLTALRDSLFPEAQGRPVRVYMTHDPMQEEASAISASAFEKEFQTAGAAEIAGRYREENEMLDRIRRGDAAGVSALFSRPAAASDQNRMELRNSDPVRNYKNYMIIENTLCRKAAEEGHVHPFYIDRLSSSIARRIEIITSMEELKPLTLEIARRYAMLVSNCSRKSCTGIVQQAVLYIDQDLTKDLSVSGIAKALSVHPNYLSGLFSKTMGVPLSIYVQKRRVEHAIQLLNTTQMPIQLIASYVGIEDANFFTKVFRRFVGMTPSSYRKLLNQP
ncbi:MAG: helix-turn-helix domain-containing protein [Lachnospira sp.]|nr:helix-turn-helix domain-containing protein [Lachnospira sp.]